MIWPGETDCCVEPPWHDVAQAAHRCLASTWGTAERFPPTSPTLLFTVWKQHFGGWELHSECVEGFSNIPSNSFLQRKENKFVQIRPLPTDQK